MNLLMMCKTAIECKKAFYDLCKEVYFQKVSASVKKA